MSHILCIETATTNCSVAISKDGEVLVLKEDRNLNYSHAERLHQFIAEVLKEADLKMSDLSAVSVSKGPGSYTGLRIGVASAKGLCYALDIPLLSIMTLKSLAQQVKGEQGFIVPMLDARRMEVYASVFSGDQDQVRDTEAEILNEHSFSNYLDEQKVYFLGNGVPKFKEICNHPNAVFLENKMPSANEMALLSYAKYINKEFENLSYFDPYYLKDFVTG